jgi:hypothetical protein
MADVIDFKAFLEKRRGQRALQKWFQRFGHVLETTTRIRDLSDEILLTLAEGGAEGNDVIDELIMDSWGMPRNDMRDLDPPLRMSLLDLSLFLIDQLRFECMLRIGWIEPFPAREVPFAELIRSNELAWKRLRKTPELKRDHPHYYHFRAMLKLDKETFLRRQIPAVLEQFRRRLKRG